MKPLSTLPMIIGVCLLIADVNITQTEGVKSSPSLSLRSTTANGIRQHDLDESAELSAESLTDIGLKPSQKNLRNRKNKLFQTKADHPIKNPPLSKKLHLLKEELSNLVRPHQKNDVDVSRTNPVTVKSGHGSSELAKLPRPRNIVPSIEDGIRYLKLGPSMEEKVVSGKSTVLGHAQDKKKGINSSELRNRHLEIIQLHESQKFAKGGDRVAMSKEYAIIGAWHEDAGTGAAYIIHRDAPGNWTEVSRLVASDGAAGDTFGWSVTMSGNNAIICAKGDDDQGESSGTAYVFERNSLGDWLEVAKLSPSDGEAEHHFGWSAAMSGNHAIISAYCYPYGCDYSKPSYVFERNNNGNWTEVAKLTPNDGVAGDRFGYSVAISGNYVIIGATERGEGSEAAYVFERNSLGDWLEVAKLTARDGTAGDAFGSSVAISGKYAIIGAIYDDENGSKSGCAYIFKRNAYGKWSEVTKLLASDGSEDDLFGYSVAISGQYAIIDAINDDGDDDKVENSGSVYVFKRGSSGNWLEFAKLAASDKTVGLGLGRSVAISGDSIIATTFQPFYVFDDILPPEDDIWGIKAIYKTVQDRVKENKIKAKVGWFLSQKLKKAKGFLEKGHANAAIARLTAFNIKVEKRMAKGRIDKDTGDELIEMVDGVIKKIQG